VQDQLDVYQGTFGLTRADVEAIRTARPKRQFLLVQDKRKRLIDMCLPPDILALTRSDGRAKEVFRRAAASGDPYWLDSYIKEVTRVHA
jgi:type IV secretion system protein VirB4